MKKRVCTLSAAAILLTAGQTWSAVLYVNDSAAYNTAIGSLTSGGTENFETLFPTGGDFTGTDLTSFDGMVINATLGLKLISGSSSLYGVGSHWGQDADSNSVWDSNYGTLTLELSPSSGLPVKALSLNVLSWNGNNGAIGTPDINVYSLSGTLIGSGTIAASTMASSSGFVGIVAGTGESIGKIVLTPMTGFTVGADNVAIAVPEPSAYALVTGLCALAAGVVRRFRRSA